MEQQSQINYRFILKRVLAYMIDIIVVTIIATLLSNVKFINNNTKEYQEMYQEFNELYKDYTNINVLINDAIKDDKITEEEYKKMADNKTFKSFFESDYDGSKINKSEITKQKEKITTYYTEKAADYIYKMQKMSISNSIITLSVTLLYFGILQFFLKGQTLGKKILKLRIVPANDKRNNIAQYILRSLIVNNVLLNAVNVVFLATATRVTFNKVDNIISFLISLVEAVIIFLVITRKDNRGIHDLLANTKVIEEKK